MTSEEHFFVSSSLVRGRRQWRRCITLHTPIVARKLAERFQSPSRSSERIKTTVRTALRSLKKRTETTWAHAPGIPSTMACVVPMPIESVGEQVNLPPYVLPNFVRPAPEQLHEF